jgi:transposase InsO family protein
MNAIMERWVGSVRRELLGRTLINHEHLRRILHAYEFHYNSHRPHMSLSGAACSSRCRRTSLTSTPSGPEKPAAQAVYSISTGQWRDMPG